MAIDPTLRRLGLARSSRAELWRRHASAPKLSRATLVLAAAFPALVLGCAREPEQQPPHAGAASGAADVLPRVRQSGGVEGTGSFAIALGDYPLDALSRAMPPGALTCSDAEVQEFAGESVRFTPPARAVPAFRARLAAFEQVVVQVSQRVFGRAPERILVAASYDCRAVSGKSRRISEHAFGNAIDITGFGFAPQPIVGKDGSIQPIAIPGAFEVRVERHWRAQGDSVTLRHARFLEELTGELLQRELFRTLLGPADPAHRDHFHFDMAPSKYVQL